MEEGVTYRDKKSTLKPAPRDQLQRAYNILYSGMTGVRGDVEGVVLFSQQGNRISSPASHIESKSPH